MKLQDFIRELGGTLEHYGNIEVDCLDFEVIVDQFPEKDEVYTVRLATSATEALTELSEEVYNWDGERGFYHPSHVYLDQVARKINKALPTKEE